MSKGKIAIIGIGEVPTRNMPERTHWDIIYDTCMEAVRDSGLNKNDIEGAISVTPQAQPKIAAELSFGKLPEELGLKGCKDAVSVNAGGASTSNAIRLAEQWITSGIAKAVLVHHVTVHSTIPIPDLINFFARAGVDLQWEYPYGTTYNIIMGLMANRYIKETGCKPEEMASVVTALRSWAAKDPNSFFYGKEVPSVEKVLASALLNTPLHKRESNVLGDGGSAMVIVSAEDAKKMKRPAAYKLGDSVRYFSGTCVMRDFYKVTEGFIVTAKEAMAQAGITKEDVSLWNCYLAYPLAHPLIAELLEVAPQGMGGKYFLEGRMSFGGDIPWSSIGDAPGRGHTGSGVSAATYVETARQLMGKAGERQVRNCKYVYQNAGGGSGFNNIATIWGKEI
ncbi:MAG TPA: thiolase family protein [Smithella sp.]|jgi:acetyl-CoA C-acetyltransferase|nr:thiolase family protein [Smithella sp.]HOG10709.1 thiolase family protein [Smithella sp.]HPL48031.1 thiolase family protein [Smithella sp.]HQL96658.1 thiolase family protein [Smithella sp.]